MTQSQEDRIQLDSEQAAIRDMRHYTHDEMGHVPGAEFVRGPLLSFCCDKIAASGIWRSRGIRTAVCSGCYETSTFREVIK